MANFIIKALCSPKTLNCKIFKHYSFSKTIIIHRNYTSSLHVPGNKANKSFAYLSLDLDFNHRFADKDKLRKELNLRGVEVDVENLHKSYEYYLHINSNRKTLEKNIDELSVRIQKIKRKEDSSPDEEKEAEALIMQCRLIKKDLKVIKEAIWDLEETVIPELLKLPNELDEQTPAEDLVVIKTVGEKPDIPENNRKSHIDIGTNLGLIDYRNPILCYLCNEAVIFELGAPALAARNLKKNGFIRVAAPDFCRSIIIEGSGMDHENPGQSFFLKNKNDDDKEYLINRLHLVGGSSLQALLAIFTKHYVPPEDFPIKIFSTGRQYKPFPDTSADYGLYKVCQTTVVEVMTHVKSKDSDEYKNEFQNLIDVASKIYDDIGCHYRIVMRPAKELYPAESKRVSIEMWSTYSNHYVEVGHIAACRDYFSRRLMFMYMKKKEMGYPATICGTLLSAQRVLACLLEQNPEKFDLPENTRSFI